MSKRKKKAKKTEKTEERGRLFLSLAIRPVPAAAVFGFGFWCVLILYFYYQSVTAPFLSPSFWFRFIPPVWNMSSGLAVTHLLKVLAISLWVLVCWGAGRGVLRKIVGVSSLNGFEEGSVGFGLGMGIIGLGSLALGFLGLLTPWPVYMFAMGISGWSVWANADLSSVKTSLRARDCWPDLWSKIAASAVAVLLMFQLFHSLIPDIFFDSLVYHLSLPHLYKLEGGLVATPTNLYSGLPMLVQWNYAFLFFFADEITTKLVQWACAVFLILGFGGLGLRLGRPAVGWSAGILFLGTPMVLYNVVRAGVDVSSSLMIFLTVYTAALSQRKESENLLPLSAVLCGLALGIKYPNWTLLPALLVVLAAMGTPRKEIMKFGAIAVLILSPWILKNLWLYGNPLFPYFHDFVRPAAEFESPWRVLHASGWGRDWSAILSSPREMWMTLAHPWYATVNGTTEFDHIGPFFLMALLPLCLFRPEGKPARFWFWTLFGMWMLWWPLTRMPRYFMAGFCIYSVLIALMMHSVKSVWLTRILRVALILFTIDGVVMYLAITRPADSYQYLIHGMPKEDYLSATRKTYPAAYYRAARWIDENTSPDARLLLVGAGRGFYMPRAFIASTEYDVDQFSRFLLKASSPEALYETLKAMGVTHLVVNLAWIWRGDPKEAGTPERGQLLEAFGDRHIRLAFSDLQQTPSRWVHVYELVESAEAKPRGFDSFVKWYRIGGRSGMNF
ncbi:MAG: hypothetical protein COB53_10460 [Elusimicrobia bacterium]|nr:MAG: hypothetical protein COB53_10460 [Elusimicrobiota bacterium]